MVTEPRGKALDLARLTGVIETEMPPPEDQEFGKHSPLGRLGRPEEIASLIAAPSPGHLVVATGSGSFTYRLAVSADCGVSWSTAITGTMQINSQAPGPPSGGSKTP